MTRLAIEVAPNSGAVMEGDGIYFARRALEERDAASRAPHPAAQRSHLEMAERYEDIETAIGSGKAILKLVSPEPRSGDR